MPVIEIRMPELSADLSEADLITWLVRPGDRIQEGDLIAEIETDKSTVEFESPASGVVRELAVAEGTTVKVGELLATLEGEAASAGARAASAPAGLAGDASTATSQPRRADEPAHGSGGADGSASGTPPPERAEPLGGAVPAARSDAGRPDLTAASSEQPATPTVAPGGSDHAAGDAPASAQPAASALARRIAAQRGVDLAGVAGSGSYGRIVKADVEAADRAPQAAAIAGAATFQVHAQCDVEALRASASHFAEPAGAEAPGLTHFAVRALALALRDVPAANVHRRGAGFEPGASGEIAVIAKDGATRIRDAAAEGLTVIADELRAAAGGDLSESSGETTAACLVSVAEEGLLGVDPVVPMPCACALGLGAAEAVPVVREGTVSAGWRVRCSLAVDERAFGVPVAAQLLAAFRRRIEDPLSMLL